MGCLSRAFQQLSLCPAQLKVLLDAGDFLMRYSDGEFLSTYHRVRSPTPDNGIPEVSLERARFARTTHCLFPITVSLLRLPSMLTQRWHSQGERYTLVYFAQPARSTLVQVSHSLDSALEGLTRTCKYSAGECRQLRNYGAGTQEEMAAHSCR